MEAFLSLICLWGPTWAPRDWALCQGQTLSISTNTALFSLIGTLYGGDGRVTFGLPDFRSRVPIGQGHGPGLSYYTNGQRGGIEEVTLSTLEMPAHNHAATFTPSGAADTIKASPEVATSDIPGKDGATTLAATGTSRSAGTNIYNSEEPSVTLNTGSTSGAGGTVAVGMNGGNQGHENRMPYETVSVIMCMQGIFPPRS